MIKPDERNAKEDLTALLVYTLGALDCTTQGETHFLNCGAHLCGPFTAVEGPPTVFASLTPSTKEEVDVKKENKNDPGGVGR